MRDRHTITRPARVLGFTAAICGLAAATSLPAAPAAYGNQPPRFADAATQPLRDVGLTRVKVKAPLQKARANPYGMKDLESCDAIAAEIASLDAVLGPDVDSTGPLKSHMIRGLAADALSGAVKIPFRGVVRRLSGAERRDREVQQASTAGLARRAYLKGVVHGQCQSRDVPMLEVAAMPAVAPEPPRLTLARAAAPAQLRPVIEAPPPRESVVAATQVNYPN